MSKTGTEMMCMMTFDGWDARFCGDAMALPGDYLTHFRTRGSKNGVRRYQQEDGTWTPLGLKLRKEREGWGETRKERRAERRVQQAEKRVARKEKRLAKQETARNRLKKKANDIKDLTDNELRQKIARAKMEQEYRELTKSPVLKAGEKIVSSILKSRENKEARELAKNQAEVEKMKAEADKLRAKADIVRSRGDTIRSVQQTKQEKYRYKTKKKDVKGGLSIERNAQRLIAKKELRESSVWNKFWTKHNQKKLSDIRINEEINKNAANILGLVKGKRAIDAYNDPVRFGKPGKAVKNFFSGKSKVGKARLTYSNDEANKYQAELLKTRQAEANAERTKAEAMRAKYQAKAAKNSKKNKNKDKS